MPEVPKAKIWANIFGFQLVSTTYSGTPHVNINYEGRNITLHGDDYVTDLRDACEHALELAKQAKEKV